MLFSFSECKNMKTKAEQALSLFPRLCKEIFIHIKTNQFKFQLKLAFDRSKVQTISSS
jgi:hypothetical protein